MAAMPAYPFAAVGAASGMALGAFHALAGYGDLSPSERALRALTAAEACCWAVRRPFHLVRSAGGSGLRGAWGIGRRASKPLARG